MPGVSTTLAATQAAYRFFHNPRVGLRTLANPLVEVGREAVGAVCDRYVVEMHDWSSLKFRRSSRPLDRLPAEQRRGDYQSVHNAVGGRSPGRSAGSRGLRPLRRRGAHCSRSAKVRPELSPLDEVGPMMEFIEWQRLSKTAVHILDAHADSVAHYRQWSACPGRYYLVRADDRLVEHQNEELVSFSSKCSVVSAVP